jgi:hypothetical protein
MRPCRTSPKADAGTRTPDPFITSAPRPISAFTRVCSVSTKSLQSTRLRGLCMTSLYLGDPGFPDPIRTPYAPIWSPRSALDSRRRSEVRQTFGGRLLFGPAVLVSATERSLSMAWTSRRWPGVRPPVARRASGSQCRSRGSKAIPPARLGGRAGHGSRTPAPPSQPSPLSGTSPQPTPTTPTEDRSGAPRPPAACSVNGIATNIAEGSRHTPITSTEPADRPRL